MMRIINKIYNWFRNIILNIMGVIMDMNNKDNEVKILAIETIRDGIIGIKNIFSSGNNLIEIGMFTMLMGGGLILAGYHKQLEDKGATDDEN